MTTSFWENWRRELSRELACLTFTPPVHTVVNPWDYAVDGFRQYTHLLPDRARVFFLGMNPGPWGMAQTGVPFGEVELVRDWLGVSPDVKPPDNMHPRRPVEGLACSRREVSGQRLWGLMRDRFGSPEPFFADQVVWPYCPLMWMKESGANLPPNQIRVKERRPMEDICDAYLIRILDELQPENLVAIGQYAETVLTRCGVSQEVVRILHPSPASPAANRGWAGAVTETLVAAGIWG